MALWLSERNVIGPEWFQSPTFRSPFEPRLPIDPTSQQPRPERKFNLYVMYER